MNDTIAAIVAQTAPEVLVDHNRTGDIPTQGVLYEKRPTLTTQGEPVEGLYNAWITLDNPAQYNSYTTEMVKGAISAFGKASNSRDVNAVVFTGSGNKAFCTGGNTKEYAEYYAGNPQEYRQYMRLFNDMVSAILGCDKPVVCRVNGMRIGGGQEIGMACDFSISQDLALFGQAGPKHGSAAIGGSTDFLPIMIGSEQAMVSGTLCEPFSAHKAYRLGICHEIVPALKIDGQYVPNPMAITDRMLDEFGRIIHGEFRQGAEKEQAKQLLKTGEVDLTALDQKVESLCTKLLFTFPECMTKSVEELRKPKLQAWNRNKENSRAWLALNMMNEARTGFRAFNEGTRESGREIDFVALRQALAKGTPWTPQLIEGLMPGHD
ncbi:MAG: 6-oxocyclohex-1-ene-1-carbonyl-CoA hydratase [Arenicellales bacterium]|jgi:6-oxo-cyclohex-1-ene-carbonyl-CoA hydrolase|nr:6-oxocyclohex-1-ene-1-carbonyl-CoA hydratase [Arenicellales bacterium]